MIEITIPGFDEINIAHLVLDYNGTLAVNGDLETGVAERITAVAERLHVHVVTADTFGAAAQQLSGLPVKLHILNGGEEAMQKQQYVEALGSAEVIAIGNGINDMNMLRTSRIGIGVIGKEGCALKAATASDVLVNSILDGLDLLLFPKRLTATLRS